VRVEMIELMSLEVVAMGIRGVGVVGGADESREVISAGEGAFVPTDVMVNGFHIPFEERGLLSKMDMVVVVGQVVRRRWIGRLSRRRWN
jgi:hypothetical protein